MLGTQTVIKCILQKWTACKKKKPITQRSSGKEARDIKSGIAAFGGRGTKSYNTCRLSYFLYFREHGMPDLGLFYCDLDHACCIYSS